MKKSKANTRVTTGSSCSAAILMATLMPLAPAVTAQVLEEVIVTAQKRSESVQDIPIAVSAFSESQLQDSGFDSISDLAAMSPSLQLGNYGPIAYVSMRGIGSESTTAGGDPGVALHLDGVYLGRPVATLFSAFDTARVEILRGPQGTLYGRNANGGSINLITNKPTDELEGNIDITYGDYDWQRVRAAVNLPISDRVRSRFVAFKEDRDGYSENSVPGGTEGNDAENWGVRSHLDIDFSEDASLLLSGSYIDSGGVGSKAELREPLPGSTTGRVLAGPPGFAFAPGGPASGIPCYCTYIDPNTGEVAVNDLDSFKTSIDVKESQDNTFLLLSATFEWNFEKFTFKSITGYAETDFNTVQDGDYSELDLALITLTEKAEQFSQELQLVSNGDGPLQWIAGLYYFEEEATRQSLVFRSRYDVFASQFGVPSGFEIGGEVESDSIAVFGQATYGLTDNLHVTAGLRYTEDEKKGINKGFQFVGAPYADPVGGDWNEVTYRLALDFQLSEDTMLFASYATGYKSGGINQTASVTLGASDAIYDPEFVTAYEVGIKSTLLDGRVQVNSSLYYNEYADMQFQRFGAGGPEAFNASEPATVQGLEIELRAAVTDTLTLDGSLGLADSEFDAQVINGVQLDGNQVQRTPDFTYNIGITNQWEMDDKGSIRLRLEYAYTDEIYYSPFNADEGTFELGGSDLGEDFTNVNARLFWFSADEVWTVEASITNLTDEEQVGSLFRGPGFFDEIGGGGSEEVTYNPPRQWGVRVGYAF
jgi:iron complex outermembrane receptor protein